MQEPPKTVLVTGYAPAPKGSAMYEMYKYAGIVLEIDPETDTIVNAEFTFVTDLARDFLTRLVQGYNLGQGLEHLFQTISAHYVAPSTDAVRRAIKVAVQRYLDHKAKLSGVPINSEEGR